MGNDKNYSVLKWNLAFLLLFLAFMAGIFFDVTIEMKSLTVAAFGLIFFPVLFIVVNMGTLNRRFPFTPNSRPEDAAQPGGGKVGEANRGVG